MSFTPYDRPVRAAFVGLGRIYDLNVRAYLDNPDVEVVALVDPSEERRIERQADWPDAKTFCSAADLAASGLEVDAVEALLPIPLHADGVVELLGYGWHVNLQKPMCNDLADAQRMLDAAQANDRLLRVMENYLFYEPLQKLKATVESGEIGDVSGYHLKMVASGRGGWDVPMSSYEWQFQQMQRGRGILVFDDGWHKLATAIWLFGPVREVRAWVGGTEVVPGVEIDAPTTIMWEHRQRDPRRVGHHARARPLPALRLLHERRALGGHRYAGATRASTAAPAEAFSSRASRSTPTVRCALTTRSTTTGRAASAIPVATGCAGCTLAMARSGGAVRTPSTCCASRSASTRVAKLVARAWIPQRSGNVPDQRSRPERYCAMSVWP